ncbi:ABC transporter substrate-binding protein [Ancylobacter terrae]|uniref:ABC transporter substrate-binding protein n=1 Tax=Ancylobacter sp. sgz301288 TaxID=3342077 RepID=UPI003859B07D
MKKLSRRAFIARAGASAAGLFALGMPLRAVSAAAEAVPAGYAPDYADIIAGAKAEGRLLVYSNMSLHNWKAVIEGFSARFPGIKVDMLDVGSRESVERYLAEAATGVATADLIATASQPGWIDMHQRKEMLDYVSPEAGAWPAWSRPFPGLYTISTDPLVFAWNALQVPAAERSKTFADFAQAATRNKTRWANRVTTYSPLTSPFGYVTHWYFIKHHGERGWDYLRAIGALPPRLENTGGPQMEKVTSGEYVASYFMSGITAWPRMEDPARAKFLDWNYIGDGQPLMMRGIAIPRVSKNPNAAKLMLDHILSAEGQLAFGRGGLTPARPGLKPGNGVRATYSSVVEAVGEKNAILLGYDLALMQEYDAFQAKLRDVYQR